MEFGPRNLPAGWSINAEGLLGDVATTDDFYAFVIKATDSSNPPQTARTNYSVQIAEPLVITSSGTFPAACVFSGENCRRIAADLLWLCIARLDFIRLRSDHRNIQRHSSSR